MSLFDNVPGPARRRGSRRGGTSRGRPAHQADPDRPRGEPNVESVAQITHRIDAALKSFGRVAVEGEVSRPKKIASGHVFFTLKDERAAIDAKIWRSQIDRALQAGTKLEDGARVVCHGTLDVYAPYGKHSLIVDRVEARGLGVLLADLERLKVRLREEGLFDRKRPLPRMPRRIGVVTSRDADAWRDFLRTRSLRWPGYPVRIMHSRVQGKIAGAEIASAIARLDASGVDVIVVCRGGGAIEDLWCFNDEAVARAVFESSVPVVTGVGHESDTTLIDYVADHRAHTPTDAAQTVIPDRRALVEALERSHAYLGDALQRVLGARVDRLERAARSRVLRDPAALGADSERRTEDVSRRLMAATSARASAHDQRLERLSGRLTRQSPEARVARVEERLVALGTRLAGATSRILESKFDRAARAERGIVRGIEAVEARAIRRFEPAARALGAISPLAVLERGYSITRTAEGAVVTRAADARANTLLKTIVTDGEIESVVRADGSSRAPVE